MWSGLCATFIPSTEPSLHHFAESRHGAASWIAPLIEPVVRRGLSPPIGYFFRSLAQDQPGPQKEVSLRQITKRSLGSFVGPTFYVICLGLLNRPLETNER
jgi:hypothetical protein